MKVSSMVLLLVSDVDKLIKAVIASDIRIENASDIRTEIAPQIILKSSTKKFHIQVN